MMGGGWWGWVIKPFVSDPGRRARNRAAGPEEVRPEFDFGPPVNFTEIADNDSYRGGKRAIDILFRLLIILPVGAGLVYVIYSLVDYLL